MARYLMSSRVGSLKWLGALQLIHGILLFAITVTYFAIDFDDTANASKLASGLYIRHVLFTVPTVLLALGAGAAGASMSRYRGLTHNISSKNAAVALSFMNGFSAIVTMALSGTYIFFDIDKSDVLDDGKDWQKAVVALIVINFIICFFDMLVAFAFVTLGCLWVPNENAVDRVPSLKRPAPEQYHRGPEPEVVDTYYRNSDRYAYPNTGYYPQSSYPAAPGAYPYGGGGGYRTLPALKY